MFKRVSQAIDYAILSVTYWWSGSSWEYAKLMARKVVYQGWHKRY